MEMVIVITSVLLFTGALTVIIIEMDNRQRKGYKEGFDKAVEKTKDAFIEKAEEYLYHQLNEGGLECGDIEAFIKLFKNYMKG